MNRKPLLLLSLLLSLIPLSLAQSWEQTFIDSTGLTKSFDVIQTSDSGYVMVGEVDLPTGAIRHYVKLIKTDKDGNELWSNIYGTWNVADNKGRAIIELSNGDLLIAGTHTSKASILKTNANGDSLWTETFGGQGRSAFHDMVQDTSGNLIVVGELETGFNTAEYEVWVMGVSPDGDSLWAMSYFTPSSLGTTAHGISTLSSHDFLITGAIGGAGFAMTIDGTDGTEIWSKTYPMSSGDQLFAGAAQIGDSSLLVGGIGSNATGFFPVLFQTNLTGDVIDSTVMTSVPFGAITSISPTLDSGFILTGSSYDFWNQSNNIGFLTKLDANLDIEWEFTYQDSLDQQGAAVRQSPDGSYILAGSRKGGMWLKKIMADSMATSIDADLNAVAIKVYPNPAAKIVNIELPPEFEAQREVSISLYDQLGKLVNTWPIRNQDSQISLDHLPRGMYHYSISDSHSQLSSGKILLR